MAQPSHLSAGFDVVAAAMTVAAAIALFHFKVDVVALLGGGAATGLLVGWRLPCTDGAGGARERRPPQGSSIRGTMGRMATPITIRIPHRLGRAEAQRRIGSGFASLINQLPGIGGACTEKWDGDRLNFSVGAMGQTVSGVVDVLDDVVAMEIELTGVLRIMAGALRGRLQKAGHLLLTRK